MQLTPPNWLRLRQPFYTNSLRTYKTCVWIRSIIMTSLTCHYFQFSGTHPIEKLVFFPTSFTCTVYGWATSCILNQKMKKRIPRRILCKEDPLHPNLDHGTFEMVGGSILHDLMLNFNHKCFFIETLLKKNIWSFENYGKKLFVFSLCCG